MPPNNSSTLSHVLIRSTAIRWNFREYRFLFTTLPFPETVPNAVCHFKGSLQCQFDIAERSVGVREGIV